ncbi:MAG TPA: helix-turn-helix domain-containing protein [Spirochaetota bacterium]
MASKDETKEHPSGDAEMRELLREFEENPFDPARKTPEDVMRIFYQFSVPIIPVISRRNTLLGIITKNDMVSEMSDIDRASSRKIDDLITRLARHHTLDEILPYLSHTQEFITINIFGEVQGRMSRVELLSACDSSKKGECVGEIEASRDAQVMEWMIYLILEHIPRALYAVNAEGRTIFYNNLFEDLYHAMLGAEEVDHELVERILADPDRNECSLRESKRTDPVFFNTDLGSFYEKIPMHSHGKLSGYLIYFGRSDSSASSGKSNEGLSLDERVAFSDRQYIVEEIRRTSGDIDKAAKNLHLTREALRKRMQKQGITFAEKDPVATPKRGKKSGK